MPESVAKGLFRGVLLRKEGLLNPHKLEVHANGKEDGRMLLISVLLHQSGIHTKVGIELIIGKCDTFANTEIEFLIIDTIRSVEAGEWL